MNLFFKRKDFSVNLKALSKVSISSLRTAILAALLCTFLQACSIQGSSSLKKSSAVELTVLSVSDQYLRAISSGNSSLVDRLVLWSAYMQGYQKSKTRPVVLNKISSLKSKWDPKDNPLSGLELLKIKVKEDEASVELKKEADPVSQKISLDLVWSGNRWLVSRDNLFGNGAIIE